MSKERCLLHEARSKFELEMQGRALSGLRVDRGRIFVSHEIGSVDVYDFMGKELKKLPELHAQTGAFDVHDDTFISARLNYRIQTETLNLEEDKEKSVRLFSFIVEFPPVARAGREFAYVNVNNGRFYYVSPRGLKVFNSRGNTQLSVPLPGPEPHNIVGLATDAGHIYLLDAAGIVYVYPHTAEYTTVQLQIEFDSGPIRDYHVEDSRFYVLTKHDLQVFDLKGQFLGSIGPFVDAVQFGLQREGDRIFAVILDGQRDLALGYAQMEQQRRQKIVVYELS